MRKFFYWCVLWLVCSHAGGQTVAEFKQYSRMAKDGNADAMVALGYCYANGAGTEKDPAKAFEWMSRAAELGSAVGMYNLGFLYLNGVGVPKDEQKAFGWVQQAAAKGYVDAQAYLAIAYSNGNGVAQDHQKAFGWSLKAANQGSPQAAFVLGYCYHGGYGVSQNYDEAAKWYRKAMEKNIASAYSNMGILYAEGKGVPQDSRKAIELADKAIALEPENTTFYATKEQIVAYVQQLEAMKSGTGTANAVARHDGRSGTVIPARNSVPSRQESVDSGIPVGNVKAESTFAVIIANETYKREAHVPYALNDGRVFAKYCEQTLGLPAKNIHLLENATLNDMKYHLNWLKQVLEVYGSRSKAIIYYAGHGIPDEASKSAYLLPVDGYGSDPTTGYALSDLYAELGTLSAGAVTVFLDACFSGAQRDGTMLASARGVAIKVDAERPQGNLVVFSAAQGDETAYPYKEQNHGMFTYYLLKKWKETKGNVTLGELSGYVTDQVRKQSIVENGKLQTPSVASSPSLGNEWEKWTFR